MQDSLLAGITRQAAGDARAAAQLYRTTLPSARWALGHQAADGQWVYGPDFLIIGAARSGTTWLKKRLSGVSAVRIQAGEPNYFSFRSVEDPRDYVASLCTGMKNADLAHDGSPRLYGEKSPSYLLMSEDKIALAKALFPDVKIILMVRDPIDRAWSHIRARTDDYRTLPDIRHLLRDGRYAEHLSRWARHFPPSQLHLIAYDDVRVKPREAFAGVLGFLGLDPDKADLNFPVAPPAPPIPADLRRLLEAECAADLWDVTALRAMTDEIWRASLAVESAAAKAGDKPAERRTAAG